MKALARNRLRCSLIFVLPFAAATLWAVRETHVYGIANFGGSGECGTSGMTHSVHVDTAAAFANVFSDARDDGKWDDVRTRNNQSARGRYFTNWSKAVGCLCSADDSRPNFGADEPDVIYVHTHGNHSTSAPWFSSLSMGNSSDSCSARTDQNMFWDDDLDIAVIKACQSGDYDVWANGGYRQQFTNSDSGFRMWNAFHGDSSCGPHVTTYVSWYASSSFHDGAGANWLDAAYDVEPGRNNDDCPVSIVFGETRSKRIALFENGGWRDRKSTGKKTGSTYFYFQGCNPDNGRKLPSD